MPTRTLVLLRHGKSDWSGNHDDRHRPLTGRGRRQAAEAGRWLAGHGPALDLAVVSPATRAAAAWELAAAELQHSPAVRLDETAYAFDGMALRHVVRDLPAEAGAVALVGHNPALEELVELVADVRLTLSTSCLAVLAWKGGWADAGSTRARVLAHGRPPTPPAGEVVVRTRRDGDVPGLVEVLAAQQAVSRYPMRWPLPFPVEEFIVRPGQVVAWTAELDGRPVGHVAVHEPAPDSPLTDLWAAAHGRPPEQLGVLGTLFVDSGLRGSGIGRRLHDTALDWLHDHDLAACLDVVPVHRPAAQMYAALGWRVVGHARPAWLPASAPDVVAMVHTGSPGDPTGLS
ncbi:GNAT family N-acetyltransferase [Nocardioides euryhalodurans]|uniref:GNAT family N-acetyltransferase n=1 Tax=Nocardioides euryhalodurans TaxID=2518370 RepID=A0A4P7GND8_9ACTN|nr:GNAT family N-acetyltransferase [Nocardioides euryhalodurans]QBR93414.1 GNAT family N-acetyltransferase [Nocardioides euryhalodurans]